MVRLPIALPERPKPIRATVGPMMTAGISLLIHSVPFFQTIKASMQYTAPANTPPRIIPHQPY